MNESTITPGSGAPGAPIGSVAVRTFATHQPMTTAHTMKTMDGLHVNATAGNEMGRESTHFAAFDEVPEGHFYDPDAEYEPDPEYAATLAPDAARQRRERIGPTGRPLPYFPIQVH